MNDFGFFDDSHRDDVDQAIVVETFVEVDISRPQADRPSICAALQVPELWVFDGETMSIEHLGADGRYFAVGRSRFRPVAAEEVQRWLVDEDTWGTGAWEERDRAWARQELAGRRAGGW